MKLILKKVGVSKMLKNNKISMDKFTWIYLAAVVVLWLKTYIVQVLKRAIIRGS